MKVQMPLSFGRYSASGLENDACVHATEAVLSENWPTLLDISFTAGCSSVGMEVSGFSRPGTKPACDKIV